MLWFLSQTRGEEVTKEGGSWARLGGGVLMQAAISSMYCMICFNFLEFGTYLYVAQVL